MAYLRQQEDDEEQKTGQGVLAPGNSTGGGFSIGGVAGSAQPQQQTPQQKAGSGNFTNLQNWLDAGKGRDKNISDTGKAALGTAQTDYNAAANPMRHADFTPDTPEIGTIKGVFDSAVTGALTPGAPANHGSGGGVSPDGIPSGAPNGGFTQLSNWLTQDYKGPMSVDYDLNNKNLRSVDALSATNTAGANLAGETPYSAGANRLDQSLFGADAASQAAIAGNKSAGTKFVGDATREINDLGNKAKGAVKSFADARANVRNQLGDIGSGMISSIEQRVADENARQAGLFGDQTAPGGNQLGGWVGAGPGTANVGNTMTDQESAGFQMLRRLIGMDAPQRSAPVAIGHREYVDAPQPFAPDPEKAPFGGHGYIDYEHNQAVMGDGQRLDLDERGLPDLKKYHYNPESGRYENNMDANDVLPAANDIRGLVTRLFGGK